MTQSSQYVTLFNRGNPEELAPPEAAMVAGMKAYPEIAADLKQQGYCSCLSCCEAALAEARSSLDNRFGAHDAAS